MGKKICLVKNETDQMVRMKKWNNGYITETKGNAIYPEAEAEQVVEAGKFIAIDATELDNLWQLKQRICQMPIYIKYRVYMGSNTHHSLTLEVAELLINGGIVFYKAPDNDELQKSLISRAQLQSGLEQRRKGAAAATRSGCFLLLLNPRFLPCRRTKEQRIQEMEQEIMSILGSSVASSYEDIGGNQGTRPMTGGTSEAKCKSESANLMLMLLDKTGSCCLFSGKDPHECSPIHIGKTEGDGGTSTADYNGGYCSNRESQDKPPARAGACHTTGEM